MSRGRSCRVAWSGPLSRNVTRLRNPKTMLEFPRGTRVVSHERGVTRGFCVQGIEMWQRAFDGFLQPLFATLKIFTVNCESMSQS